MLDSHGNVKHTFDRSRELVEAWRASDLPSDLIEPLASVLTRLDAVRDEYRTFSTQGKTGWADLAERIADGQITFAQGVVEHRAREVGAGAISSSNSTKLAPALLESVHRRLDRTVLSHLDEHGAEMIDLVSTTIRSDGHEHGQLEPVVASILEAADHDAAIAAAGARERNAWLRRRDLSERYGYLSRARSALLALGVRERALVG